MTSAVLVDLLQRQPFRPFRFVLGDSDDGVYVDRPSQVTHNPGDRFVIVTGSDGGEWIIDLDRVAMIVVNAPKGGGK